MQSFAKVAKAEVFENMGTVNERCRPGRHREPMHYIPVAYVRRERRSGDPPADEWEPLKSQCRARVEVDPSFGRAKAAPVLHAKRVYICSFGHSNSLAT
jgi:hypothetical protein